MHLRNRYTHFLVGMFLCTLMNVASAQIEVAPTRVILTMRERSQEINVSNPSDNQVEVNADLGFKLIRTDSLGSQTLDSARTAEEASRSGRNWVKIFPRRFTLAPRSSRLVRVMVTIPDSAATGEYWARLIVAGTPLNSTLPVDLDSAQGIETNISMRMELDLPIIIRKGNVETGIALEGLQGRQTPENTVLLVDTRRTGNSAYRGTVNAVVRDGSGSEIASVSEQYTTEFALRKALRLPRLSNGTYTVRVESQSVKLGGANEAVIPAPTVAATYTLAVNGSAIEVRSKE